MYSLQGKLRRKELVTHYNEKGQMIKRYWYWNGETEYHNVETFLYAGNGSLTSLIDSFADGEIQTTNYVYNGNDLEWRVTLNQQNDTCDFRSYPGSDTSVQRWYLEGKSYRYDTSVFERENVKREYYGCEDTLHWHYKFQNRFDMNRNLISVKRVVGNSIVPDAYYYYDKKNLLRRKKYFIGLTNKRPVYIEYYFEYK